MNAGNILVNNFIMENKKWKISVIFLAIICGNQSFASAHNNCTKFLNQFIESQKRFEQCAMKHAVPVSMCVECVEPYVSTVQTFHDLSMTPDPIAVRHKCVDQFIGHNALNIIWNQYQSSRDLWNKAACKSCFVEACDPDKMTEVSNVTAICTLNKNVIDIRNKKDNLMKCFNTSDTKVGNNCADCLNEFTLLANQYKQFGETSNGICFDVVDEFNCTSSIWYGEKQCPLPNVPNAVGWTVVIVLMCLLILGGSIGGGYFLFTKYRQRENYSPQTDSDNGSSTPPIYS